MPGGQGTGQHADRGRLAGAGRPDDAEDGARRDQGAREVVGPDMGRLRVGHWARFDLRRIHWAGTPRGRPVTRSQGSSVRPALLRSTSRSTVRHHSRIAGCGRDSRQDAGMAALAVPFAATLLILPSKRLQGLRVPIAQNLELLHESSSLGRRGLRCLQAAFDVSPFCEDAGQVRWRSRIVDRRQPRTARTAQGFLGRGLFLTSQEQDGLRGDPHLPGERRESRVVRTDAALHPFAGIDLADGDEESIR